MSLYHWNSLFWSKVKKQSLLDFFWVVQESVSSELMHKIDSSILWVELVLKPGSFRKLFARLFFFEYRQHITAHSNSLSVCLYNLSPFLSCTYHALSLFCILVQLFIILSVVHFPASLPYPIHPHFSGILQLAALCSLHDSLCLFASSSPLCSPWMTDGQLFALSDFGFYSLKSSRK